MDASRHHLGGGAPNGGRLDYRHSLRVLRNPIAAGEPVSVEVVGLAGLRVELVDLAGKPHASQLVSTSAATLVQLYSAELAPGLYLVRVVGTSLAERVVIR